VIDDLPEATLTWCRTLPLSHQQDGVFLCHATPTADDEDWLDYRATGNRTMARDLVEVEKRAGNILADIMLCGHTHTPRSVRLPDGRRIVNVGSVGCPAYLDTRIQPNFIQQTGAPDARYAILTERQGDWIVSLRSVPYDPREMIRLAEEKDAPNWATALRTAWFA
ncbi:MAG: metallophosphoesterase family protein, partial [Pseudomonadota bacterium]